LLTALGLGPVSAGNGAELQFGVNAGNTSAEYDYTNAISLNDGIIFEYDAFQHVQGTLTIGAGGGTLGNELAQKGVKVVILGGGISGLVAAYEMKALGYDCTVLEARPRPGGRNWTVRGGDTIAFLDGSTQTCTFDPGNYQNVGPARLPSIHKQMLDYCRKLGVELQVEVNTSRSTLLQNDAANGGKPLVQRQVVNDTRGHVSELLAKCVANGALDQDITATDRDHGIKIAGYDIDQVLKKGDPTIIEFTADKAGTFDFKNLSGWLRGNVSA